MRLAEQHEKLLTALESDNCNAFAELTRTHVSMDTFVDPANDAVL